MYRAILCGLVSLAVACGCQQASTSPEQKSKGRGSRARGTVESVDVATGKLTIKVRNRQDDNEVSKTFQVEDNTTITSFLGEAKKESKGRSGLSDPQFKEGSRVSLTTNEDGSQVLSIQVGDLPQRGRNRGKQGAKGPPQ